MAFASISNKPGELSDLYNKFHLRFKQLRTEVTQPLSETEMGALDEAARKAITLVFQRLKTQLAAIPPAFAPSVPNPQADVSPLFRRVSWIDLHRSEGQEYYKDRAPQLVAQIGEINDKLDFLEKLHRSLVIAREGLSVEAQHSILTGVEQAATPAAIEALKRQIQELEETRQHVFEGLRKIGDEAISKGQSIRSEIDGPSVPPSTKRSLYADLEKIQGFADPSVQSLPPRTYLSLLGCGPKEVQKLRSLINKTIKVRNRLDQLEESLIKARDQFKALESICSNLAFVEAEEKR